METVHTDDSRSVDCNYIVIRDPMNGPEVKMADCPFVSATEVRALLMETFAGGYSMALNAMLDVGNMLSRLQTIEIPRGQVEVAK